ncbi:MAG: hypothetical protein EBR42_08825 [Betaproteobacteria bacterium]|jgi:hypothetical protein|nr:hypothetical protein [Betaproteobacteria bacterium]
MKKTLALLLLALLSSLSRAEWQAFSKADDGDWYVESPLVQPSPMVRVWTLFDHHAPVGAFGVLSVKTMHELDCAQQRMRDVNIVVFNDHMARGSILRNTYPGTQLIHPPPGSVFEQLMTQLCQP